MSALDQLRAESGARRATVVNSLDTSERAMANSLDRILVRAAESGTTGAAAGSGALPRGEGPGGPTPQSGPGGPGVWLAATALVVGGGLLAFAIATSGGDESAATATAPAVSTQLADTPLSPTGTPADPQPSDSDPSAPPSVTADTVAPTGTTGDDAGAGGDAPVLLPTDGGAVPDPVVVTEPPRSGTGDPTVDSTVDSTIDAAPDTSAIDTTPPPPPPPSDPSSVCGSGAGLPAGAVATDGSVDFDGDGTPDQTGLYNGADGTLIVIDRSSDGLTEVGNLGDKPVGDISGGATLRGILPEGSEAQLGLVIDDLDDDGESVWVRPVALADCTPVALEIPADPELPGGNPWNGASFSDAEFDYGLQCLDEGDVTVLTFRSFDDVPAQVFFDAGAVEFVIDVGGNAANPGCWT